MKRINISGTSSKVKGIIGGLLCFLVLQGALYFLLVVARYRYVNIWHYRGLDFNTAFVTTLSVTSIVSSLFGLSIATKSKLLRRTSFVLLAFVTAFLIQGIVYVVVKGYF